MSSSAFWWVDAVEPQQRRDRARIGLGWASRWRRSGGRHDEDLEKRICTFCREVRSMLSARVDDALLLGLGEISTWTRRGRRSIDHRLIRREMWFKCGWGEGENL